MGAGYWSARSTLACTRGATAVTYIVVLGLVSLLGGVAFAEFGESIRNGVRAEASAAAKANGDEVDGPVGSLPAEVATAGAEQLAVQGAWALAAKAGKSGFASARRTRRGRGAQSFDDKRPAGGDGTRDREPPATRSPEPNTTRTPEPNTTRSPDPTREPRPSDTPRDLGTPPKAEPDGTACTTAGCRPATGQCFVAGTLISTPHGLVPIETIAPGDAVFSRDEQTGETSVARVLQTFVRGEAPLVRVRVADDHGQEEEIVSTHGHPFFSVARGWVRADELTRDELLLDAAGGPVWALAVDTVNEPATVYNFEVAGTHSYFVGARRIWVHNLGGSLILGLTLDQMRAQLARLRAAPGSSAGAAERNRQIRDLEAQIAARVAMDRATPTQAAPTQAPGTRTQPPRGVKKEWQPPPPSDSRSGRPARQPDHVYPDQGSLPSYRRPGMGNPITTQTIQRDQGNPSRTEAGSTMAVDQSGENPRGLRNLGISRNHIIADSSIARLLTEARNNANTDAARADVDRFIDASLGPGPAADEAKAAFRDSQNNRKKNPKLAEAELDRVIRATSTGPSNLRFDDATLNSRILHGADYELQEGRMSNSAAQMREATLGLARHGAVSRKAAFDAVQPTIKVTNDNGVRRGEYQSSTTTSRPSASNRWGDLQDPDTLRPAGPSDARQQRAATEPPPPRSQPSSQMNIDSDSHAEMDSDRGDDSDSDRMDTESQPPRKRSRQCD